MVHDRLLPYARQQRLPLMLLLVIWIMGGLAACNNNSLTCCAQPTQMPGKGYRYHFPIKTGGTVVIGDWQSVTTANSLVATSSADNQIMPVLWDSCLMQLPDLTLGAHGYLPDQCSAPPEESSDGQTTTLRFPTGMQWSDNQPLTATDYAFFVALAKDPNVDGAFPFNAIATARAVDATTLVITWKRPFAPYLYAAAHVQPLPLHSFPGIYDPTTGAYNAAAAQKLRSDDRFIVHMPATNGPYMLDAFDNQQVALHPNPRFQSRYFHPPVLDHLIFLAYRDRQQLVEAYKTGVINVAEDLDSTDRPQFAGIPFHEILMTPSATYTYFAFNQRASAPNAQHNNQASLLGGPRGALVRRALIAAFDRCAALQTVLGADCHNGTVVTNQDSVAFEPGFNAQLTAAAYNPQEAARLLDQAGYPIATSGPNVGKRLNADGTPLQLDLYADYTATSDPNYLLSLLAQQAWESALHIAIAFQLPPMSSSCPFMSIPSHCLPFDIELFRQDDATDPGANYDWLRSDHIPTSPYLFRDGNNMGVDDPAIDHQLDAAQVELHPQQRQHDYQQLQQYLANNDLTDPLYVQQDISLATRTLGNYFHGVATAMSNEWNIADWFTTR